MTGPIIFFNPQWFTNSYPLFILQDFTTLQILVLLDNMELLNYIVNIAKLGGHYEK